MTQVINKGILVRKRYTFGTEEPVRTGVLKYKIEGGKTKEVGRTNKDV